ncbi:hypothetical protein VTK26DRAFT_2737 [Humicola hyalothermophila]
MCVGKNDQSRRFFLAPPSPRPSLLSGDVKGQQAEKAPNDPKLYGIYNKPQSPDVPFPATPLGSRYQHSILGWSVGCEISTVEWTADITNQVRVTNGAQLKISSNYNAALAVAASGKGALPNRVWCRARTVRSHSPAALTANRAPPLQRPFLALSTFFPWEEPNLAHH